MVTTSANHTAISLSCAAAGRVHIVIQKGLHSVVSFLILITTCLESFPNHLMDIVVFAGEYAIQGESWRGQNENRHI